MISLRGKSAIIFGSKRLGAIVAKRLSLEGVNLTLAYRNSKKQVSHLQRELIAKGGNVEILRCDISSEKDVISAVSESVNHMGDLQFIVNLASEFPRTPYKSLNGESWDRAMEAAKGNYLVTLYGSRQMMGNVGKTKGHIVMFGDWAAGETPYLHYLPYLTSKASISFMNKVFALELSSQGILVNAIAPGPTIRPEEMSKEIWDSKVISKTPLGRESSAEEIAELVVILLKSETITGEMIRVDSGRHLSGEGLSNRRGKM
jgi:NAD(P)-dependent dehydrogenase (short-subunit alcohol dehydrogenase family)